MEGYWRDLFIIVCIAKNGYTANFLAKYAIDIA